MGTSKESIEEKQNKMEIANQLTVSALYTTSTEIVV